MADRIYVTPQPITPGRGPKPGSRVDKNQSSDQFGKMLAGKIAEKKQVTLSGHAKSRLESRNINLTEQDMAAINDAADRAAAKGSRNALILSDKFGLITNVPNRAVITALDPGDLKENIVTNIDSAVFV